MSHTNFVQTFIHTFASLVTVIFLITFKEHKGITQAWRNKSQSDADPADQHPENSIHHSVFPTKKFPYEISSQIFPSILWRHKIKNFPKLPISKIANFQNCNFPKLQFPKIGKIAKLQFSKLAILEKPILIYFENCAIFILFPNSEKNSKGCKKNSKRCRNV